MDIFNELNSVLLSAVARNLLPAVLQLLIGLVVVKLILKAVNTALERSRLERAAHSLIRSIVKIALYALLISIVAPQLGINLTSVIAIASVATLAVSLALQTALSNVVGGFTLLTNHPFKSGDFVEISGQSGTVLEVGITYTKLLTPDNKVISLPNSSVTGAQIVNYSVSETRRVDLPVDVSYDDDPEDVLSALKEAADLPWVLEEPGVFTGITQYGESAISYVLRFWVKTPDYWDAYFAGQRKLAQVLKAHGMSMTYPHLNVHIEKD